MHHARNITMLALVSLVLAGCGGGETVAGGPGETIAVTAVDYGFQNLPDAVAAGTALSLTNNTAAGELHELVAIRLPDGEDRSIEELLALPEEEQAVLGEPATVIVAMPDSDGFAVVGDGTLADAGRYLIICAIPKGADPAAYMAAAEAAGDGPPEVDGGPPHFTLGMVQELEVR